MFFFADKFYTEAEQLATLMDTLEYKDEMFGKEIPDFYHVPKGIENGFAGIVAGLKDNISLGKKSGVFRKPFPFIHFENFNMSSLFIAVIALKPSVVKFHKHTTLGYEKAFDLKENVQEFIQNDCMDNSKWSTKAEITLEQGDLLILQPWNFHSVESELVKVFYINNKTAESEEAEEKPDEVSA
jgi:hypothetical protein